MSASVKCFSQRTVESVTLKPSIPSTLLIKLHQRVFSGFFCGKRKKCRLLGYPRVKRCYNIQMLRIDVQEISFSFSLKNLHHHKECFHPFCPYISRFNLFYLFLLKSSVIVQSGVRHFLVFDVEPNIQTFCRTFKHRLSA